MSNVQRARILACAMNLRDGTDEQIRGARTPGICARLDEIVGVAFLCSGVVADRGSVGDAGAGKDVFSGVLVRAFFLLVFGYPT